MDEVRVGILQAGAACVVALPLTGRWVVWVPSAETAAVRGWASRNGLRLRTDEPARQCGERCLTFETDTGE